MLLNFAEKRFELHCGWEAVKRYTNVCFFKHQKGFSINYPVSIIISDVFLCLPFPQLEKNIKKAKNFS